MANGGFRPNKSKPNPALDGDKTPKQEPKDEKKDEKKKG
jgi:hypothetical protein